MRKRIITTWMAGLLAAALTACSSTTSGVDVNATSTTEITDSSNEEVSSFGEETNTIEETSEKTTEFSASETEEAEETVTTTEAEEAEEKETTTAKETTVKETTAKETTKSETTKAAETTTAGTPTTAAKVKAVSMDVKVSGTHYVGDTLAASDFTVTVNYSDGRTITNSAGFTASPLKLTGYNNTVTVTYESISKSVTVTAADRPAETEAKAEVPETTKAAAQPTTAAPTTAAPTTAALTTAAPTTAAPTTAATIAPTTVAPTTVAPTTVAPTTAAPVYESTYGQYSFREATDQIIQSLEADSGHDMKLDPTMTKLAQAWADYLRAEHAGSPIHSTGYGQCEYVAYIPQVYPGHDDGSFRSEQAAIGGYVAMGITNHVSQFATDSSVTNIGVGISRSADGMFGYEDIYVVVVGTDDDTMDSVEYLFKKNNADALPYLNNPSENLSSANYN